VQSTSDEIQTPIVIEKFAEQRSHVMSHDADAIHLRRWLVASGPEWYPVGEYVSVEAQAAIERAVDVFGAASDWDAAPLPRPTPGAKKYYTQINADENR
jgi:hypothetical protein